MCKAYRKMRLFLCPFGGYGGQKRLFRGVRGVALSKRKFFKIYLRNYSQFCSAKRCTANEGGGSA